MLQHEKAEVIQECIDLLKKPIENEEGDYEFLEYKDSYKTLEKFKTKVDALAEQEGEKMCKELWNDQETIKVGVPGACIEMTPAEMQKRDYRRP